CATFQPIDQEPKREVWARSRKDVVTMHHETRSSPAGMFRPIGRLAESNIIKTRWPAKAACSAPQAIDFEAVQTGLCTRQAGHSAASVPVLCRDKLHHASGTFGLIAAVPLPT